MSRNALPRSLCKEVAERKRAEEYYQTLVETIPHIVVRKDREGRYTFVNSTSRQWAGFQGRDMLGKDDSIWAPPELRRDIRALDMKVMSTGKTLELVRAMEVPGVVPKTFLHSIRSPIRDEQGRITGVQMIAWDVTREKEAEQALRAAKEQADAANKAKSQFLANMSTSCARRSTLLSAIARCSRKRSRRWIRSASARPAKDSWRRQAPVRAD